jgi:purine nucleosidase
MVDRVDCYCYTCIKEEAAYGQVILDDGAVLAVSDGFVSNEPNATVCKTIDNPTFKERMFELLLK